MVSKLITSLVALAVVASPLAAQEYFDGDYRLPRRGDFAEPRRGDFAEPRRREFAEPRRRDMAEPRRRDFLEPRRGDISVPRSDDFVPGREMSSSRGSCERAVQQAIAMTGGELLSVRPARGGNPVCTVTVLVINAKGRPKKVRLRIPMDF